MSSKKQEKAQSIARRAKKAWESMPREKRAKKVLLVIGAVLTLSVNVEIGFEPIQWGPVSFEPKIEVGLPLLGD